MDVPIEIDIDNGKIDNNIDDKIDDIDNNTGNDKIDNKPHNGKPITKIEVSPNEKYLVTYSEEDRSIVGWNFDIDEGQLKSEFFHKINDKQIYVLCVSDDKKLAYIYVDRYGNNDLGK